MAILTRFQSRLSAFRPGSIRWRAALLVFVALASGANGWAEDQPTDYQVKAAFLERFGKFVEWPDNAFANPDQPLVIGVFGENPFGNALKSLAADDTINGHRVVISEIKDLAGVKNCNVVFIPASEKGSERDDLAAVANLPILTVGETDDFYDAGGMIQFVVENNQVHFRIRNEAARAAGLKISSKLLILARRG